MSHKENVVIKIAEKIIQQENLKNGKINIKPLSTEGANYSAVLFKVTIKSTNNDNLNLFFKVANLSESIRNEMKDYKFIFENEIYFYTNLDPMMKKLQNKYDIPLNERFNTCKYYGSSTQYMEETLVLEDLVAKGYTLYDRFLPLDGDYTFKAVEELAKFHALSFTIKHKKSEEYDNYNLIFKTRILEMYIRTKEMLRRGAHCVYNAVPDEMKNRFNNYIDKQLEDEMFHKYYGPGKWKVLVHGDYRASNIMHKEKNGKVSSLVPVDYQTLRLGSPSTDLLYLIYTGTDETFRRAHLPQLLDLYYDTLSSWLRRMELDPDLVFSRKDFNQDYQEMLPYGLNIAIFILPVVLVDPKQAPSLSSEGSSISEFVVDLSESYKERFLPILEEFSRIGII